MFNAEPHAQVETYQGYRGLPPLLGLHTMPQAATTGLAINDSVARLKLQHWMLKRAYEIFVFRLNAEPIYELKMAFSLHLYQCADFVGTLQTRIREMREPPYGLDESPSAALDMFFDEIKYVPDTDGLLLGLYEKAFPALLTQIEEHIARTNRLFDYPTWRALRSMVREIEEAIDYGRQAIDCLVGPADRQRHAAWLGTLDRCLAVALASGAQPAAETLNIPPMYSNRPYEYDSIPGRDERFHDLYNQGVNAEAFLFDETMDPLAKTLMLYFKRMREIDVPEFMSSILQETQDKPWNYYRDMARQLWDEARHAMMGEVGLVASGLDWTEIPLTYNTSLGMNTRLTALERHSVLFTIEQGLMGNKDGKRTEWELAVASSSPLSALIQDYDWADEIIHARIGREWLVEELGSQDAVLKLGDAAWDRFITNWRELIDKGLTQHANWWPAVYKKACEHWGVEPGERELAYSTSYEGKRSDAKQIGYGG